MRWLKRFIAATGLTLLLGSCSSPDYHENEQEKQIVEPIEEAPSISKTLDQPKQQSRQTYPWMKARTSNHPPITKEYFRCKGSILNPPMVTQNALGQTLRYFDCGGKEKHSLPLKEEKETIYPILVELLNHIQDKTGKRVVITSGHRCPEHNTYIDSSKSNQTSKHMIGAEVSFYVLEMEDAPEAIVKEIYDYYWNRPEFENKTEYLAFSKYQGETNVSTPPTFNKEVFVKIFRSHEGRNFDNRHPYPYISIQVRHDREDSRRVSYSWNKAHRNYLRY